MKTICGEHRQNTNFYANSSTCCVININDNFTTEDTTVSLATKWEVSAHAGDWCLPKVTHPSVGCVKFGPCVCSV